MTLRVLDFKRSYLRVFLFLVPAQATPGKTDDTNGDENDADDYRWFHDVDATAVAGR